MTAGHQAWQWHPFYHVAAAERAYSCAKESLSCFASARLIWQWLADSVHAHLQKSNGEVVAAKSVLIIGGGAVGVELAGDSHI